MASLYALILAGGASSRFWPLSGDDHPKYLLRPDGKRTLIELAFERALACTEASRILVVTSAAQADGVRKALPALPAGNLCIEPARRDTAAAITLGCKSVAATDGGADVLVLPADTLIEPGNALAAAVNAARASTGFESAIHVFGVRPAEPQGGYGYIQRGDSISSGVFAVRRFVEKPGEGARELIARGFLWNVGCSLFRLETFDRELASHLPAHSKRLRPAQPGPVSQQDYQGLESISIDYGLIEKAGNLRVAVVEATFDDIGTWDALLRSGAVGQGRLIETGQGNVAIAPGRTVAVVGADDLLVVADGDRILVMRKGAGQQVKQVGRQAAEPDANA
ncbi:MAG: mannose-1-phosphate guanylyltransferase [Planctomycetes bacterium]|nr:mannose-1-phosphate guanylyltransferase [Planctomycetota bacterium]